MILYGKSIANTNDIHWLLGKLHLYDKVFQIHVEVKYIYMYMYVKKETKQKQQTEKHWRTKIIQ